MLTFFLVVTMPALIIYLDFLNKSKGYWTGICTGIALACSFSIFLQWIDPKV